MSIDSQRIKFINKTMDHIHDLSNSLYESLIDQEYPSVCVIVKNLTDQLQDINETFKDEI